MLHKLSQQNYKTYFTVANRLPNRRARQFLLNYLRLIREDSGSFKVRAALGLLRWSIARTFHSEIRTPARFSCFITGRFRGMLQRFTVTRTKVKPLTDDGLLFGVRKSSW